MRRRDLALLIGGLLALTLVGYLVGKLITGIDLFTDSIDRPVIDWFAEHRSAFWDGFMRGATRLGAGAVITGLAGGAGVASYLATRDARWPAFLVLAGIGGVWLDKILKPLVGRERPDFDRLVDIGGFSFPSGHATGITALWLALALFVWVRSGGRARWVWVVAGLVIGVVLVTRPYLGVHYPTDVIAGAALSAVWVALCARATGVARLRGQE